MGQPKGQLYLEGGESEFQMDENVAEFSNSENNSCLLMLLLAEVKVKSLTGLCGFVSSLFHHSCVCVCPLSVNVY